MLGGPVRGIVGLSLPLLFACCETSVDFPCADVLIESADNEVSICANVARTAEERRQGLLAYPPLTPGGGLYFVFPAQDELCFHTEGLGYTITTLWISDDGRVVAKETMPPATTAICHGPAQYVLEALPEELDSTQVGDQVTGPK